MVDGNFSHVPNISYRRIGPTDLTVLEKLHIDMFPVRYEADFFQNVVYDRGGIFSWGAVDRSHPDGRIDELVGFITARVVLASECDPEDTRVLPPSRSDYKLVYVLTLGVVEPYRNRGIGTSLIYKVCTDARKIRSCCAVYLHVLTENAVAIHVYRKVFFRRIRKLHNYYYIDGMYHDAYLYFWFLDDAQSSCGILEVVRSIPVYVRGGLNSLAYIRDKWLTFK